MSFMEELRMQRQQLIDALEANQGDINLDIFEDFYPDKAHFVFELLQNAEDTGATECLFALTSDELQFRHNGTRQFSEGDIKSITGIHNSTKTKSSDQIGKFGVGFKSVFIYTLTPQIHSGEYSFSIKNLVMPETISRIANLGDDTVFLLPFNNPEKVASEAYLEIEKGLEILSKLTLLFLKNIKCIRWLINGEVSGRLSREEHSEYHVEILKEVDEEVASNSHFLRFSQPVTGLESQHVCLAFPLESLSNGESLLIGRPIHETFRIVPAKRGRVSVFFPAEKENSGLRFHIHAPFIPTLDRSSVKDTETNEPLFKQVAYFAAECLHEIHRLKLLNSDFLGILPNPQDNLPSRYEYIREVIVNEMNSRNLTPTASGGYSSARQLFQAKANLKELLSPADLDRISPHPLGKAREWAVSANQKNSNVDRFLVSLDIKNWGVDMFVSWMIAHFSISNVHFKVNGEGLFDEWLKSKPLDWIQKLYALLWREGVLKQRLAELRSVRMIRLTHGKLGVAQDSFFDGDVDAGGMLIKWVAKEAYGSGDNSIEQKESYEFLVNMGVKNLGEKELVEMILRSRYSGLKTNERFEDMKVFLNYFKSSPGEVSIFKDKGLFLGADGEWHEASEICIDEPFKKTGLRRFYQLRGGKIRTGLSGDYLNAGLDMEVLVSFAEALGATLLLPIQEVRCGKNPNWEHLKAVPGQNLTNHLDQDYAIYGFERVFEKFDEEMAGLAWLTICNTRELSRYLTATYRKNLKGGSRTAPSQLVYQLKRTAWVPQVGLEAVSPPYAQSQLLPAGFPFDPAAMWVKQVEFGAQLTSQLEAKREENAILKESLGIEDDRSIDDIRRFARIYEKLSPEQRQLYLDSAEREIDFELPENEPKNEELRRSRVVESAKEAIGRKSEIRQRSVSVGREAVKGETFEYLRQQYTNFDGVMICQVCQQELPFRRLDGAYFYEAVEFLTELNRRYHQNYLALCPNHAAMFMHANSSKAELRSLFNDCNDLQNFRVNLAGKSKQIYFTETHRIDLKTVIQADSEFSTSDTE